MDSTKLKNVILLNGDTCEGLANAIGISRTRLSAKIHGRNGAEFTQAELRIVKDRYKLSDELFMAIFFTENVS